MFNKKISYPIAIIIGLIILAPQVSFGAERFGRDLFFGLQQDSDIMKLQEFLASEGLYSGPITGNFFSLTLKAVKAFQSREGITPAAGYFGPKTRVRANALIGAQIQASEQQAAIEGGKGITQSTISQTANNSISNIQLQLDVLLKQVNILQQQLQVQQQTQQTSQNTQSQTSQQASTVVSEITKAPANAQPSTNSLEITSISIGSWASDLTTAQIYWQTSQPTDSAKIYIYQNSNDSTPLFSLTEHNFSKSHSATLRSALGLVPGTNYVYKIIATNAFSSTEKNGTFSTPTPPPGSVEISSDKSGVKNDGMDYATLTIKNLSPNQEVQINGESYVSDGGGLIIYKTQPTTRGSCDSSDSRMIITVSDGEKFYTKILQIINVQSRGGPCA